MTATLTDLGDAIVTALNGVTWSQTFTAERVAIPQFKLTDLATLRVHVVVMSSKLERLTRTSSSTTVEVHVAVVKKIQGTGAEGRIEAADIDPYVALADEFVRYFHAARLAGFTAGLPTVTRPDPVYDDSTLRGERTFISVVRLEYKVFG